METGVFHMPTAAQPRERNIAQPRIGRNGKNACILEKKKRLSRGGSGGQNRFSALRIEERPTEGYSYE
jgi:hypothetical protein